MQCCIHVPPFRLFTLVARSGDLSQDAPSMHACMLSACLRADLHSIGGLPTVLKLLQDPEASVRWRAAEVVATCVQNNPPVQQVGTPGHRQRCAGSFYHDWKGMHVLTFMHNRFPHVGCTFKALNLDAGKAILSAVELGLEQLSNWNTGAGPKYVHADFLKPGAITMSSYTV